MVGTCMEPFVVAVGTLEEERRGGGFFPIGESEIVMISCEEDLLVMDVVVAMILGFSLVTLLAEVS